MIKASVAPALPRMDANGFNGSSSYGSDVSSDNRQLDLELNHFLEAEFALYNFDYDPTRADPLRDELHFIDIKNSIDIPDLDFGDSHHQSLAQYEANSNIERTTNPTLAAAAEVSQSSTSLRVVIPMSVLFPPPASDQRLKRKQPTKQPSGSSIWSKRQRAVKEEMMQLRQQVNRLEAKLERLQHTASSHHSAPPSLTVTITDSELVDSETQPTRWEQILRHEIEEKQKSEAENAKLRQMLDFELETTQRVGKMLRTFQDYVSLEETAD